MKKVQLLALLITMSIYGHSQNNKKKIGFGININQFQVDYGLGIHLISPYLFNSKLAIKTAFNYQWLQHKNSNEEIWTPYQNAQIGIRGKTDIVDSKIFIYGEGGVIGLLPNKIFSEKEFLLGGYGLFGFEFGMSHNSFYFIEMGGTGTGAVAEKVEYKPIYSNGFLINVGFRIYI